MIWLFLIGSESLSTECSITSHVTTTRKEALKKKFGDVDGSKEKEPYTPGSYVRGSFRNGNYSKERGHSNKAQNIIGIIGLILVAVVLVYIAKFYSLL